MASMVPPQYGVAFTFAIALVDQSNTKLFKASPTIASGDFKLTKDFGALANLTNLPTNSPSGSVIVQISLTATEMQADNVTVVCIDASGNEWASLVTNIQTSARRIDDLTYPATSGRSTAIDASGQVTVGAIAANAITATAINADAITAAKIADGAIDAATFAAGAINAAAIATDAITSAKIAADAIGASELAADAVTEIQSGLATAAALATVAGYVDTEVASILAAVDTEVAAIKAKTDNLPADTATTLSTLQTSVDDLPTNAELATSQAAADDATLAAIAALNNLSAAQVNAEVDTALADYDAPTKAELDAAVAPLATQSNLNSVGSAVVTVGSAVATVDTVVDAILNDTGNTGVVVAAGSKSGYALSSTGLDSVAITAPSGVASNFREMIVQLWRRHFKKSTLTATELRTYADNGSDALTTQTVSDDNTTQTMDSAT